MSPYIFIIVSYSMMLASDNFDGNLEHNQL